MIQKVLSAEARKNVGIWVAVVASSAAGASSVPLMLPDLYRPQPYTSRMAQTDQDLIVHRLELRIAQELHELRAEILRTHLDWRPHPHTHLKLNGPAVAVP